MSIGGDFGRRRVDDGGPGATESGERVGAEAVARTPSVRVPEKIENAARTEDSKLFPALGNQPDRQFVGVAAASKKGGGWEVTLATYKTSIAGPIPGHQGEVEGSRRTYRVAGNKAELVSGPEGAAGSGALKIKNLTTERIVNMQVDGDDVRIHVGIGAGFRAAGGAIGLEIEGKKLEVKTKRGDDSVAKLDALREKIEAAGYTVTETKLRGLDTIERSWKIEKKAAPGAGDKTGAELAADVERMLKGKVTPREREKLREIATSIPIIDSPGGRFGPRFPPGFQDRVKAFGDMVVKLREDKKLYAFLRAVEDMELERYPPIPAGEPIKHVGDVLSRYGLKEAKKAFDASMAMPDDWPWDPQPGPGGKVKDLGALGKPGETLGGKTQTLKPGETLRFTTAENQITGMSLTADPADGVKIERTAIERPPPGMLGGMTTWEYKITVPAGARPGATVKLTSTPTYQARNNPDWKFDFDVKLK